MKFILITILSVSLFSSVRAQEDTLKHILFIKGGSGTGGFLEGWGDDQLSSIFDYSTAGWNHGWGEFSDILRDEGFILEEISEGPSSNNTAVDLVNMTLSDYSLLVFGSNNAHYSKQAIDSVEEYIRKGGSALFISDANWGSAWDDAPDSDQLFLDRFGWTMNQDKGTYAIGSSEFLDSGHPILKDVSKFDGEGVSPISLTNTTVPGVSSTILARAKYTIRRNTVDGPGPVETPTSTDAVLIVAHVDSGRIAGHFDRNTFFNTNGAGSNIHKYSNTRYAVNLYHWLTSAPGPELPDTIPPAAVFPEDMTVPYPSDIETVIGANGPTDISDNKDPDPTVSYSYTSDQTSNGTCSDVSFDVTITWKVEDESGNSVTGIQNIYVRDQEAPEFTAPSDITRKEGQSIDPDSTGRPTGLIDNSGLEIQISHEDQVESENELEEIVKRTWTATDVCGNGSSEYQYITIEKPSGTEEVQTSGNGIEKAYPVPTGDIVTLNYFTRESGEIKFSIYDLAGRCVDGFKLKSKPGKNNLEYSFRANGIKPGMYTIVMESVNIKDGIEILVK